MQKEADLLDSNDSLAAFAGWRGRRRQLRHSCLKGFRDRKQDAVVTCEATLITT